MVRSILSAAVTVLISSASIAHPNSPHNAATAEPGIAPAAQAAARVVDQFHAALRRGDMKAALSLLAEDALVFESGGAERRKAEYASQHLQADAEFAKAVQSQVTKRAGEAVGNLAWIATEGRTTGSYRGKPIDLVTTETMVLLRSGKSWRITHIHWSSATR